MECLHFCQSANLSYKNNYPTLNLLLWNNHYYTILDKQRLFFQRLKCFACGQIFQQTNNFKRHMINYCDKRKIMFKKGMIESSYNLWEKAKEMYSIPDNLLPPYNEQQELYYTQEFCAYDFESLIVKKKEQQQQQQQHIEDDNDIMRDDDDDDDDDDAIEEITINVPVSYAIAVNFTNSSSSKVYFNENRHPRELIRTFVRTLSDLSKIRRDIVLKRYEAILNYITKWF